MSMANKTVVRLSEEEMNELKQLSKKDMNDIYLSIGKNLQMRDERIKLMGAESIEDVVSGAKKFMEDNSLKLRKIVCPIYKEYKKDPELYNNILIEMIPLFGKFLAIPVLALLAKTGLDIFCKKQA